MMENEMDRFEFFGGSKDGDVDVLPKYAMVHQNPVYHWTPKESFTQTGVEVYHRGEGNTMQLVQVVGV